MRFHMTGFELYGVLISNHYGNCEEPFEDSKSYIAGKEKRKELKDKKQENQQEESSANAS